jgi:hypothetical protein
LSLGLVPDVLQSCMIVELDERLDIFAVESQRTGELPFAIFFGDTFCYAFLAQKKN